MYSKKWVIFMLTSLLVLAVLTFKELPSTLNNLRESGNYYIQNGLEETGVLNQVTGILLDYRSFDTLGEATVIFAAAAIISFFAPKKKVPMLGVKLNVLVKYGVAFILPYLFIFGFYIILFGHLSPGGGFTGGVILASTVIIFDITFGFGQERVHLFSKDTQKNIESFGMVLFIFIGLLGVLFETGFLTNSTGLIQLGKPGYFFSGGWIPMLNVASGLKVGAGLAIIFKNLVKES